MWLALYSYLGLHQLNHHVIVKRRGKQALHFQNVSSRLSVGGTSVTCASPNQTQQTGPEVGRLTTYAGGSRPKYLSLDSARFNLDAEQCIPSCSHFDQKTNE
jgi:hypothetical protein